MKLLWYDFEKSPDEPGTLVVLLLAAVIVLLAPGRACSFRSEPTADGSSQARDAEGLAGAAASSH